MNYLLIVLLVLVCIISVLAKPKGFDSVPLEGEEFPDDDLDSIDVAESQKSKKKVSPTSSIPRDSKKIKIENAHLPNGSFTQTKIVNETDKHGNVKQIHTTFTNSTKEKVMARSQTFSTHLGVMMHGYGKTHFKQGEKMSCLFPYIDANQKSRASCTQLEGKGDTKFCKVGIEDINKLIKPVWINCSTEEVVIKYSATDDFINQREAVSITTDGSRCRFPFIFNGQSYSHCSVTDTMRRNHKGDFTYSRRCAVGPLMDGFNPMMRKCALPCDKESEKLMNWELMEIERLRKMRTLLETRMSHKSIVHKRSYLMDLYRWLLISRSVSVFVDRKGLCTDKHICKWISQFEKCKRNSRQCNMQKIVSAFYNVNFTGKNQRNRLVTFWKEFREMDTIFSKATKQRKHVNKNIDDSNGMQRLVSLFNEQRYLLKLEDRSRMFSQVLHAELTSIYPDVINEWTIRWLFMVNYAVKNERKKWTEGMESRSPSDIVILWRRTDALRKEVCSALDFRIFDNTTIKEELRVLSRMYTPDISFAEISDQANVEINRYVSTQSFTGYHSTMFAAKKYATTILSTYFRENWLLSSEVYAASSEAISSNFTSQNVIIKITSRKALQTMPKVYKLRIQRLKKISEHFASTCHLIYDVETKFKDTDIKINKYKVKENSSIDTITTPRQAITTIIPDEEKNNTTPQPDQVTTSLRATTSQENNPSEPSETTTTENTSTNGDDKNVDTTTTSDGNTGTTSPSDDADEDGDEDEEEQKKMTTTHPSEDTTTDEGIASTTTSDQGTTTSSSEEGEEEPKETTISQHYSTTSGDEDGEDEIDTTETPVSTTSSYDGSDDIITTTKPINGDGEVDSTTSEYPDTTTVGTISGVLGGIRTARPQENPGCKFPFLYKGKMYMDCIKGSGSKYVCVVKNKRSGEVMTAPCTRKPSEKKNKGSKTVSISINGKRCRFPFKYNNQSYSQCTSIEEYGKSPVCKTKSKKNKHAQIQKCAKPGDNKSKDIMKWWKVLINKHVSEIETRITTITTKITTIITKTKFFKKKVNKEIEKIKKLAKKIRKVTNRINCV